MQWEANAELAGSYSRSTEAWVCSRAGSRLDWTVWESDERERVEYVMDYAGTHSKHLGAVLSPFFVTTSTMKLPYCVLAESKSPSWYCALQTLAHPNSSVVTTPHHVLFSLLRFSLIPLLLHQRHPCFVTNLRFRSSFVMVIAHLVSVLVLVLESRACNGSKETELTVSLNLFGNPCQCTLPIWY